MNIPDTVREENITIEVTTRCTSACRHCFARAGRTDLPEMSPAQAREIICEGRQLGFRRLHITGGEPLLWGGLKPLMAEALEAGYENIFLNTNGHLLDGDAAKSLASQGDSLQISVSLQGSESHHDYYRGSGSCRKATAGIGAALDAGIPTHIFTTVDRELLENLPRFVDSTARTFPGIRSHTLIQLIRVAGDTLDLSKDLLSPDDFIAFCKMTALLRLSGHPVFILENPLAVTVVRLLGMDWLPGTPSLHRSGRLVILADGAMTLAHSTRDSFGMYRPGKLEEIISSEGYQYNVSKDVETCPGCPHIKACRESGMLRPSEWFRDMKENPYCRRVLDKIIAGNEGQSK